jgi:hypothetical protein
MKLPAFGLVALCALASAPSRAQSSDSSPTGPASSSDASPSSSSASSAPTAPALGVGDVRPQGRSLGLGVAIGAPVGLAGKYYLNGSSGLSFILGFWGTEYGGAAIDFVFHPLGAVGEGSYGTPFLTVGGGAALGLGNNTFGRGAFNGRGIYQFSTFSRSPYVAFPPGNFALDVHGVLGLGWSFKAPLDLFVEFAPSLLLVPTLNLGTRLTLGGRIYLG